MSLVVLNTHRPVSLAQEKDLWAFSRSYSGFFTSQQNMWSVENIQKMIFELNPQEASEIYPLYPLDPFTSGLFLFTLNEESYDLWQKRIQKGKGSFSFEVFIYGSLKEKALEFRPAFFEGSFQLLDFFQEHLSEHYISLKEEVPYQHYSLLKIETSFSHVKILLYFLYFLGAPVMGDTLFSHTPPLFLSQLKKRKYYPKKDEVEKPLLARPAIHLSHFACESEGVSFQAQPSKDWVALCSKIEKYDTFLKEFQIGH